MNFPFCVTRERESERRGGRRERPPLSFLTVLCSSPTSHACLPTEGALKATANQPFNSTAVAAYQPIALPPPPPLLRFASIYTDHMVLQAAPARATVWGFANTDVGENVVVEGDDGIRVVVGAPVLLTSADSCSRGMHKMVGGARVLLSSVRMVTCMYVLSLLLSPLFR
jgi:hypothetical protein